jgi:3-dehydroquinate synthase
MEKIKIRLKKKIDYSYDIAIGQNILTDVTEFISILKPNKIAIITDSNVKRLYGGKILSQLKDKSIPALMLSFQAGEENKNRQTKEKIENLLLARGFKRNSLIIAFGGGVVGDLAGYVASTYMRGIPYIQLPTTLLAMVDSSIGGKTGIDTQYGKNTIGTFYQPNAVFIDTEFLKTLPKKELLNGFAEMIKHGVIKDKKYFDFLDNNLNSILNPDEKQDEKIVYAIKRSCQVKKKVVQKDEKEEFLRKTLNFGHTIGHAVEKASDYKIKHGQAIAFGMLAESKIAKDLGVMDNENFEKIASLIKKAGFSGTLTELKLSQKIGEIIENTKYDKKNAEDKVRYVLPVKIGKTRIDVEVSDETVEKVLGEMK